LVAVISAVGADAHPTKNSVVAIQMAISKLNLIVLFITTPKIKG
jgi:hypothetical protein